MLTRREFLEQSLTALGGAIMLGAGIGALGEPAVAASPPGSRDLPPLPFAPDALRGLSAELVRAHHERHFAGHLAAREVATAALARTPLPPAAYAALKQQEAYHHNAALLHTVYFDILGGDGQPGRQGVVGALQRDFGSLRRWREDLLAASEAAGEGWGVTVWEPTRRRLTNVVIAAHQPGAVWGAVPLIALDAWEHAYYHDYGPDKSRYFAAFFTNLHWGRVQARFRAAGGR